jgi:DNA polymerase III subunit chi
MSTAAQVDFYILAEAAVEQRQLFACRLAEKAYKLGHSLYIHTEDARAAQSLDALLWRFQATSFVPHALAEGGAAPPEPVAIGWGDDSAERGPTERGPTERDVLINLTLQVPAFYRRFKRISEIVVQAPEVLQATRSAWRFYQEQGCALQRHDLRR